MSNIVMRFPEGKKKALTLSYDDGKDQDIRLVSIMQKNGLKGTFNLNSAFFSKEERVVPEGEERPILTVKQAKEIFIDNGMEVAVHGLTHPHLEQLPINRCLYEVARDRENLEQLFGTIIRGMAYPYGSYNEEVIECLKRAGIAYSRTTETTEKFSIPTDWLRLPATCHHNHPRLMEFAEKFVKERPVFEPWLFYVWGHSYEFDKNDNWDVIENFAACVGGRDDIWYATNLEIYEYIEAYRQLVLSMDGSRIMNPTAYRLYFEKDREIMCIEPGETI